MTASIDSYRNMNLLRRHFWNIRRMLVVRSRSKRWNIGGCALKWAVHRRHILKKVGEGWRFPRHLGFWPVFKDPPRRWDLVKRKSKWGVHKRHILKKMGAGWRCPRHLGFWPFFKDPTCRGSAHFSQWLRGRRVDVLKGIYEILKFSDDCKFPFSWRPCIDLNDFVGACAVEWGALRSPQASHSEEGRRQVRTSPAIFLNYPTGVSHILIKSLYFLRKSIGVEGRNASGIVGPTGCAEAVTG